MTHQAASELSKNSARLKYHTVLQDFTTEAELEKEREEALVSLVGCFEAGCSFLRLRIAIETKHERLLQSTDTAGDAFDLRRLLDLSLIHI